jgi:hypothetical protein
MNVDKQNADKALQLVEQIGDVLNGESMQIVMAVLGRIFAQCAVDTCMDRQDFIEACSHIYDVIADNSDEAIH